MKRGIFKTVFSVTGVILLAKLLGFLKQAAPDVRQRFLPGQAEGPYQSVILRLQLPPGWWPGPSRRFGATL